MVLLFYITYINVDLAHHKIFRAKVGKGGIKGGAPSVHWGNTISSVHQRNTI